MLDPQSPILHALYNRKPEEAARLADGAATLTIWEAAALGRDADVERCLAADRQALDAFAPDGHVPIGLAAFFGHASTVRLLLARGADARAAARNAMNVQPLHAAAASRRVEVVTAVLEGTPDVNARQQAGYTPLMGAAAGGSQEMVDVLLQAGADPSLVSEDGKTAADVAREHGHPGLADHLHRPGAGASVSM
jgi:ankyrin repeat protein